MTGSRWLYSQSNNSFIKRTTQFPGKLSDKRRSVGRNEQWVTDYECFTDQSDRNRHNLIMRLAKTWISNLSDTIKIEILESKII